MDEFDPSAARDAAAKETATSRSNSASAEIEAIHARLIDGERRMARIETAADKLSASLDENTKLTAEVLGYVRNGKIFSSAVKWLVSVGAAVAAIITAFKGHS
jgi:hypothetical protein